MPPSLPIDKAISIMEVSDYCEKKERLLEDCLGRPYSKHLPSSFGQLVAEFQLCRDAVTIQFMRLVYFDSTGFWPR
nr:hypothetical protein CFP56_15745 [Quercus suber]